MNRGGARLARALKVWLDIVLVVAGVVAGLLVLWLVLLPLVTRGPDRLGDASVPVAIGSGTGLPGITLEPVSGDLPPDGSIRRPVLVKSRGELRFQTSEVGLQLATILGQLLRIAFVLVAIHQLRAILKTIAEGTPFDAGNHRRLGRIGLLLIAVGTVVPWVDHLVARWVLARLPATSPGLAAPVPVHLDPILAGLLLLVLAAVFGHGADLERDRSLTI